MTVLNGNGVTGSASKAGYLLGQRGYPILTPPNGIPANAPSFDVLPHEGLLRSEADGARRPRRKVASLFGSADVAEGDARDSRARQRRDGDRRRRADVPRHARPCPGRPDAEARAGERRRRAPSASLDLLRERQQKVAVPADGADRDRAVVLDRPGAADAAVPDRRRRASTRRSGSCTDRARTTTGACRRPTGRTRPCSASPTSSRNIGGRALQALLQRPASPHGRPPPGGANYWVVNTLLDRLSNETMLAIAKGLRRSQVRAR